MLIFSGLIILIIYLNKEKVMKVSVRICKKRGKCHFQSIKDKIVFCYNPEECQYKRFEKRDSSEMPSVFKNE